MKVFSRRKQKTLSVANPVLSNPSGKNFIYRKMQDRKKDEPYYKELTEEIVTESVHTITLKNGEKIVKMVYREKTHCTEKSKPSKE